VIAAAQPVIPNFGGGGANSCVRRNGAFCWDWVSSHWDSTLRPALVQHIELSLIAVGIGFVLALLTALVAYRFRHADTPLTLLYALLYTVPALALFQLLVPIFGLSRTTAEVALVSYTLLILFRNILTGLREVPEEVRESARAMGLNGRQVFWKVELPLAVPAIVAGLRIAIVTVIGLATIAVFVDNEGLGAPIYEAIHAGPFNTELFAAAALAFALALAADGILVAAQRVLTPWARSRRAV